MTLTAQTFVFLLSYTKNNNDNINDDNDSMSPCTLIFGVSTQARGKGARQNFHDIIMTNVPYSLLCHAPWQLSNREVAVLVSVLNKPCRKSALYLHEIIAVSACCFHSMSVASAATFPASWFFCGCFFWV